MQENKFTWRFAVDYQDINEDATTSLPRVMHYFQEMSLLHSQAAGYPTAWFTANDRGFLVTNWQVEIGAYPKWGDRIEVMTWPARFKGIIGERSFLMVDTAGNTLAAANSNWVFTDIAKHKPVKISEEMIENYGPQFPAPFPVDFKMPEPDTYTLVNTTGFTVRRSDIDTNHHVNNIRYIGWALDYVPDDLYYGSKVRTLKTTYKKECRLGDPILLETYRHKETPGNILTLIKSAVTENALHAMIETLWQ